VGWSSLSSSTGEKRKEECDLGERGSGGKEEGKRNYGLDEGGKDACGNGGRGGDEGRS
jgi:hypothetical protein